MCAIVHGLCVAQIANWWQSTSWGDNRVALNGSHVCHGLVRRLSTITASKSVMEVRCRACSMNRITESSKLARTKVNGWVRERKIERDHVHGTKLDPK